MSDEIAELVRRFELHREEAASLVDGLSDAQLAWRPSPRKWSVAEHLAHLTLTYAEYVAAIRAATERARAQGLLGAGPFRYGWIGRWFVASMAPPPRPRVRTLKRLVPQTVLAGREVLLANYGRALDDAIAAAHAADGVDLGRARMRSPFLPALRLSLGSAFEAMLVHDRRHFWLMREVMESSGFADHG